jgi:hypothetical protein
LIRVVYEVLQCSLAAPFVAVHGGYDIVRNGGSLCRASDDWPDADSAIAGCSVGNTDCATDIGAAGVDAGSYEYARTHAHPNGSHYPTR